MHLRRKNFTICAFFKNEPKNSDNLINNMQLYISFKPKQYTEAFNTKENANFTFNKIFNKKQLKARRDNLKKNEFNVFHDC